MLRAAEYLFQINFRFEKSRRASTNRKKRSFTVIPDLVELPDCSLFPLQFAKQYFMFFLCPTMIMI